MTDQEINIAIAEACGKPMPLHKSSDPERLEVFDNEWKAIPNYCADLNAMHEAESTFDGTQAHTYNEALCRIATPLNKLFPANRKNGCDGFIFHATALQRAEAFLRVKGLWK